MGRTSIPCSDEVRQSLVGMKQEDETWDACLNRLVNQMPAENEDVATLMSKLEELSAKIDELEGGSGGSGASVNEIREAVRVESRNGMQDALSEMKH